MPSKQKTIINIPRGLDSDTRQDIAQDIIDFIIDRTKKGIDKDGKLFKKYSAAYKATDDFQNTGKSSKVNLTLTGDMLESITTGLVSDGVIVLQMEDSDSNDKASHNKDKGREFLGISDKDKNRIISKYTNG